MKTKCGTRLHPSDAARAADHMAARKLIARETQIDTRSAGDTSVSLVETAADLNSAT
jgi:hypothetical protein